MRCSGILRPLDLLSERGVPQSDSYSFDFSRFLGRHEPASTPVQWRKAAHHALVGPEDGRALSRLLFLRIPRSESWVGVGARTPGGGVPRLNIGRRICSHQQTVTDAWFRASVIEKWIGASCSTRDWRKCWASACRGQRTRDGNLLVRTGVHISTLGEMASHCATGWLVSSRWGHYDGAGHCIDDLQVESSELHVRCRCRCQRPGWSCQKKVRCQWGIPRIVLWTACTLHCSPPNDRRRGATSRNGYMLRRAWKENGLRCCSRWPCVAGGRFAESFKSSARASAAQAQVGDAGERVRRCNGATGFVCRMDTNGLWMAGGWLVVVTRHYMSLVHSVSPGDGAPEAIGATLPRWAPPQRPACALHPMPTSSCQPYLHTGYSTGCTPTLVKCLGALISPFAGPPFHAAQTCGRQLARRRKHTSPRQQVTMPADQVPSCGAAR